MVPSPYVVFDRRAETRECATLVLAPLATPLQPFQPGQFTVISAPGVCETAVSISGDPSTHGEILVQTVRAACAASKAVHDAASGTVLGVRGPYGTNWDLPGAVGHDLVLAADGVGLAPLRPVLLGALANRARYRRITLVVGARDPAELLYRDQLHYWAHRPGITFISTVDNSDGEWGGRTGPVTAPLAEIELDPARTVAFLCGPEPMMRFSAELLSYRGLPAERIRLFLEGTMRCGSGPVVHYGQATELLGVRQL